MSEIETEMSLHCSFESVLTVESVFFCQVWRLLLSIMTLEKISVTYIILILKFSYGACVFICAQLTEYWKIVLSEKLK